MSLFKWSIPERRSEDRILPDIPNEIYLEIFKHIVPPSQSLTPEQLRTFTRLSGVCRFFANVCLPRTFESIQFDGYTFDTKPSPALLNNDSTDYEKLRGHVFCTQIVAKHSLAPNLAKYVQECRFSSWPREDTVDPDRHDLMNMYTVGMSHMTNIRRLEFSCCYVDADYWGAIVALRALEELSFDECEVFGHFVDCRQEKQPVAKVLKLPHLRLSECTTHDQSFAHLDLGCLHTLTLDCISWRDLADWLPQCALTELRLRPTEVEPSVGDFVEQLDDMLVRSPPSVKSLCIFLYVGDHEGTEEALSAVFDILGSPPGLQSFTLKGDNMFGPIALADAGPIPLDKLSALSSLRHLDIFGIVLRLVNGRWSEVPTVTA